MKLMLSNLIATQNLEATVLFCFIDDSFKGSTFSGTMKCLSKGIETATIKIILTQY